MGPRAPRRQWHRRRLQRRALLRRCRGALLLRRHVSDAKSDRRQGHHGPRRLRVNEGGPAASSLWLVPHFHIGDTDMASATLAPSPAASPTAALTLANVIYEKRDDISY